MTQNSLIKMQQALRVPSREHILVAAHRADWRNAPENSLPGILNCMAMGVDIVEIDVRITKDGQLVLMHDKTLDRTTTGAGPVKDHTLDEIRKLYLKDGLGVATRYPVPTLQEVLEACKGKIIVFIDKAYDVLPAAFALVERLGMQQQCLFEGKVTAAELRRDYPWLAGTIRFMPRVPENDPASRAFIKAYEDSLPPSALIFSVAAPSSTSLEDIRVVRRQGNRAVLVSTMWPGVCAGHDDDLALTDAAGAYGWLIDRGATILCTDRPALLLSYLRSQKKHP